MYLLFDIGGTNIRLALSDGGGIKFKESFRTPDKYSEVMKLFQDFSNKLESNISLKAIAGGVPGFIDSDKGIIKSSINLPDWVEKPFTADLEKLYKTKAYLQNDADLTGLGEAVYGAGKGFKVVAYLVSGTGFGGVRIVEGKIDVNTFGFEPGYQIIDADSSIAAEFLNKKSRYESNIAYLQRFVSGRDIEARFGENPNQIEDAKIWDNIHRLLAIGLNNTIVHWSPDVVVLGGGVLLSDKIDLDKVKLELRKVLRRYPDFLEIKKAKLGDTGGLYGALAYLKNLKE